MFQIRHTITLLFNINKVHDRQIIEGIGHYIQSSKVNWDIYLAEDFLTRLEDVSDWAGDGIIAGFDDINMQRSLENITIPVIGIGGSYVAEEDYPNTPYVASDNVILGNNKKKTIITILK